MQQLHKMVMTLADQVQQHQSVFQDVQALKDEIASLRTTNQALAEENELIRSQLAARNNGPAPASTTQLTVSPPTGAKRSFASVAATSSHSKPIAAMGRCGVMGRKNNEMEVKVR
jgi:regulator of replication initiation timing